MPKNTILIVDDDEEDQYLMQKVITAQGKPADSLLFAEDGELAIQLLENLDSSSLPKLIVLDLNMPRMDGKATLKYLKSSARYESIPVIICSTSENHREKNACEQLGALTCLTKPAGLDEWNEMASYFCNLVDGKDYVTEG